MKKIQFICLLIIVSFIGCKSGQNTNKTVVETSAPFKTFATYTYYNTAMGQGRGLIFRVRVTSDKPGENFRVDSLIIHNRPFRFGTQPMPGGYMIEANYLHNRVGPSANPDGTVMTEPEWVHDGIVEDKLFYPAWVVVSENSVTTVLPIVFIEEKPPAE